MVFSVNNNNEAELRIAFSEERFAEELKKYYQDGVVDNALFRQIRNVWSAHALDGGHDAGRTDGFAHLPQLELTILRVGD